MRFATYNIRHAQGLDGLILPQRVARTIAATRADVVGLQEVWHLPRVQKQTDVIAGNLALSGEFAEAHRFGGLRMGNSVLARGDIVSCRIIELPGRTERRMCLLADLEIEGVALRFATLHLTLHRATRTKAIELLAKGLPLDKPLVVAGDFNAGVDELAPLRSVLTVPESPPPSFPSLMPRSRLDHVAFSHHWRLEELVTIRSFASDHLPVVAELSLR